MNTAALIYQVSKELPENEAREVLDFVAFLKTKKQRLDCARCNQEATDMSEFDQFGLVFDGQFNREECYN